MASRNNTNQFGGSLGGPFKRDRTFYFFSYEGQREHGGLPGPARVPTGDEIAAATAANGGGVNPVVRGLLQRRLSFMTTGFGQASDHTG